MSATTISRIPVRWRSAPLGLLGEQYPALNVGFEDPDLGTTILKDGGTIQDTKSAMVLEDLIGQFPYNSKGGDNQNFRQ